MSKDHPLHSTNNQPDIELRQLTNKQLRELCRERNLKEKGNKNQLISYLMNPELHQKKLGTMTLDQVHTLLKDCGIDEPEDVNLCLKAGIARRYVRISDSASLDAVFYRGPCWRCRAEVTVSVREILYQKDYPGITILEDAVVSCARCFGIIYVTRICEGKPQLDSGEHHNHCTECDGFGVCIGDWKTRHCWGCGEHYFYNFGENECECEKDDAFYQRQCDVMLAGFKEMGILEGKIDDDTFREIFMKAMKDDDAAGGEYSSSSDDYY
eukprot:TRINITY_DN7450_c0_g1_i1.p1 TRINITY_DN7450_c0_g1~~TRINITY_DN7450_c0_g1_i1.p1  ORF type:complete len:268 (+),score=57.36 TRINITY_DN7450_c0_g1_i1:38-841(+)